MPPACIIRYLKNVVFIIKANIAATRNTAKNTHHGFEGKLKSETYDFYYFYIHHQL